MHQHTHHTHHAHAEDNESDSSKAGSQDREGGHDRDGDGRSGGGGDVGGGGGDTHGSGDGSSGVAMEVARPAGVMPMLDDRWDGLMMGCWAQLPQDRLTMEQVDEEINSMLDQPDLWEWPGFALPPPLKSHRDDHEPDDLMGTGGAAAGLSAPYDEFEDLEGVS